jgi:hypothetical protein
VPSISAGPRLFPKITNTTPGASVVWYPNAFAIPPGVIDGVFVSARPIAPAPNAASHVNTNFEVGGRPAVRQGPARRLIGSFRVAQSQHNRVTVRTPAAHGDVRNSRYLPLL